MPKKQRLSRVDFASMNVVHSRRFFGTYFTMSVVPKEAESSTNKPKFACVVSKKIAARAVDRNRIRRFCKEAFRTAPETVRTAAAIVFYAKKESKRATFAEVAADIQELVTKTR
jgi:ribonuclease P protein component